MVLSQEGENLLLDNSNSSFGPAVRMEHGLPSGAEPTPQFGPASARASSEGPIMVSVRKLVGTELSRIAIILGLVATCGWSLSLAFFAWKLASAFLSAAGLT